MTKENTNVRVGFGVILIKDGKILLGKRHDDPIKADSELHGEGTWTMPGGKLRFQESFEDACYRETLEETGIKINRSSINLVSIANDMVDDAHFVTVGFACWKFAGKPRACEPDEITEWKWFALDKLPEKLFMASKKVLDSYLSGSIYRKNP